MHEKKDFSQKTGFIKVSQIPNLFSLSCVEKNVEKKISQVFLRIFVTKLMYRIWVFPDLKPRRHSTTISEKIQKLLLSPCYHDWQK